MDSPHELDVELNQVGVRDSSVTDSVADEAVLGWTLSNHINFFASRNKPIATHMLDDLVHIGTVRIRVGTALVNSPNFLCVHVR